MATSFDWKVEADDGRVLVTPPSGPTMSLTWIDAAELSTKLNAASKEAAQSEPS